MHTKTQTFYLAGIMLLVGLLLGVSLHTVGSQTASPALREGDMRRYQVVPAGNAANPYVYFVDTRTGRCWLATQPGGKWKLTGPLDQAAAPH